jgi:hypothetical protein
MWRSLFELRSLLLLITVWVAVSFLLPPLLYAVLPISVFLLYRAERWQELFLGFLICLILSDMNQDITGMLVMKTAKYTYIVALTIILLMERQQLQPFARIFPLFLPFFLFCLFPILRSPVPVLSAEKTLSYALIFFVVPNMVLANYRRSGWDFFRNLIWFILLVLTAQKLMPWVAPEWWSFIGERFRGLFGNPNGLAIFTYLTFVLFAVINHLRPDLFSTPAKVFIYAVLVYYVITCGAPHLLDVHLDVRAFRAFLPLLLLPGPHLLLRLPGHQRTAGHQPAGHTHRFGPAGLHAGGYPPERFRPLFRLAICLGEDPTNGHLPFRCRL